MKTFIAAMAAACLLSAASYAGAVEDGLIAFEKQWAAAYVKKDIATIGAVLGDDWIGQSDAPKPSTKAELVGAVKSGKLTFTSLALRDIKVRVFGTVAVVQGYDDETSHYGKEDTSGSYAWIDVLEKRGGKWVAVASQVTKVKK